MRDTFTRVLAEVAREHPELVLVTGDLGFGVLFPYMKEFPDRFINAGIAEQSMMSMAAGMALEGKTVVVYSIGNFPTLRCLEQIRNCAAYHSVNVKIVCVGGGFVYGSLGMTHHATEDMAALRILPGVRVYAPADAEETAAVMRPFLLDKGTAYLRIGRGGEPRFHAEGSLRGYKAGTALEQLPGRDAMILTAGGILKSAMDASALLKEKGLSVGVASFPTLKPLDDSYLKAISEKVDTIFTLEEHQVLGGLGGAVCEAVCGFAGKRPRVIRLGMRDEYSAIVGSQSYLLSHFGLDGAGVAARCEAVLKGNEA